MSAWLALTKKEFRLGIPAIIVALFFYAGITVAFYLSGNPFNNHSLMILAAFLFILALHFLFLPLYLYYSFNTERKRLHLWLHTPMSIPGLLLSKLVTGLVYMMGSFSFFLIGAILLAQEHIVYWVGEQTLLNFFLLLSAGIFVSSLFISVIFVFYWSIFLILTQRMNGFLSFIVTFILAIVIGSIHEWVMHTSVIDALTNWGAVRIEDVLIGIDFSFIQEIEPEVETLQGGHLFYIGHVIRETIIATLAFFAACWMIDRKVEV
jgi:hypothetical protein